MVGPRWKKVLSDLWGNKMRTLLVVFSIFIGVFAVGAISGSQIILSRELQAAYLKTKPSHAQVFTTEEDSFDDDLVEAIRDMDQVEDAEARRTHTVRVLVGQNDWRDLQLIAVPDYDDMRLNRIKPMHGKFPPDDKEVLIERSGLAVLQADIGERLLIEEADGKQRWIDFTGVVHDLGNIPSSLSGTLYGYVTFETMEWLGQPRDYTELHILVAGNSDNIEHNREVAEAVQEKIRKSGRDPGFPWVPTPNQHPLNDFITNLTMIMGALGVMAVFLSGFLVTNTIAGLLTQQIRQIGIMKTIGARTLQIVAMYMVLVFSFGLIALAIAVPAGQYAANTFSRFIAGFFNFDLTRISIPSQVLLAQAMVSLVVPVLAALVPVFLGTRVTIHTALSSEGGSGSYGRSWVDRLIQRVRGLPRPLLLSLRNTFRRKGRVTLTLTTLTLGGAIFISIFSVRDSLMLTLDDILDSLFNYDVDINFDRQYNTDYLINEALSVPGVTAAEAWSATNARRLMPDDTESLNITLFGIPPDTRTMNPQIVAGRWLLPEDENALVISNGVLNNDPDIAVGDEIVLMIKGRETTWRVVGIMVAIGTVRWSYTSYDYFGRVMREPGEASSLRVLTAERTLEYETSVMAALEEHFKRIGIGVTSSETMMSARQNSKNMFDFIVVAMLMMAILIAVVGGLGLMGTMSLNVLERTREIGVMRAIGASNGAVLQIFMVEGVMLGILSWMLAASIALPFSKLLCNTVGMAFFSFALSFSFSSVGLLVWLIISIVLAAIASFLPAWNAARVTVRDVLAYE